MTDAGLPRRRFHLTINIGGDSWEKVLRELEQVHDEIERHGPECSSVGGGCTSGHSVNVTQNPDMTNEKYYEAIEAWKASRSR